MKIKVIKQLNTRIAPPGNTEPPSTHFQKGIERLPGEEIEVLRAVKGENIITPEGSNDLWYFDGDNKYYWSGGVEIIKSNLEVLNDPTNYNFLIKNITPEIKRSSGKNVFVAILDTGCVENHEALTGAISHKYNALNKSNDITDNDGHGTFVAGIIAGRNRNLTGIAPQSKLIIVKVSESFNGITEVAVSEGLRWLIDECPTKPAIINLSLQFSTVHLKSQLAHQFNQISSVHKISLFAAAEDNDNLLGGSVLYPASEDSIIGVGGLSSSSEIVLKNLYSKINQKVKFIVPNISFFSSNNLIAFPYGNDAGSSFATATLSGVAAIIKSGTNTTDLIDRIDKSALPINNSSFENNVIIFKST